MNKIVLSTFLVLSVFTSCSNYGQLKVIADLPGSLDENSGLATYGDSTVWVIEDGGNKDEIYQINLRGDILKSLKVKNGDNQDWEDLTTDKAGNLYIGDIGNNANKRKDLIIYKLPNPTIEPGDKIDAVKIKLHYPDQKDFPPKKEGLFYDSEAIFHHDGKIFIVTKNRSKAFTGEAHIYSVPDTKGTYEATLIGSFTPCKDWKICQITSIDISPKGDRIVALSYGKLFIFTDFTWDDFTTGNMQEIDLGARSQLESVCFLNDDTLLISDEKAHSEGGNLYTYSIK
ncbi:MAG TPA: hypothetical protein DCG42_09905 [Maribacter sp.]|uniref:hypothetical protein n=1 Tax=unclassified Maribacter TaxID=2615042 RepID=UPI000EE9FCAC|nr:MULTISPECIES: hypothetical protein [unclassified Maribacter]HAF77622.1 hypothetical protein [Maribacter sp.]|tara:strand:+ start:36531 stop:37388 length:858 start_codon:yes stop_codon:yes gene_type:complete